MHFRAVVVKSCTKFFDIAQEFAALNKQLIRYNVRQLLSVFSKGRTVKISSWILGVAATGLVICGALANDDKKKSSDDEILFTQPERLMADDELVKVESPGYACPGYADIDGDGMKDLLVGQFAGGKIKVYKNLGDGKFAKGEWLETDGEVAEIPGVW